MRHSTWPASESDALRKTAEPRDIAKAALTDLEDPSRRKIQGDASFKAPLYEGAVYIACVVSGTGVRSFTAPIVTRIFLINTASFGVLVAARELLARTGLGRRPKASSQLRHA